MKTTNTTNNNQMLVPIIEFGNGSFRSTYVSIAAYDLNTKEISNTITIYSSGWVNRTYFDVMYKRNSYVEFFKSKFETTNTKNRTRNNYFFYIKKKLFKNSESFNKFSESVVEKAHEWVENRQKESLKDELELNDGNQDNL